MEKIIGRNIEKSFGDRLLFSIPELKIEENERIGIVGNNGTGKTTFLNIIAGKESVDKGKIEVNGSVSYMKQFDTVPTSYLSGGEKTNQRLYETLRQNASILILDEPTNHLDIQKIKLLEERLKKYKGTLLIVSHDRKLLDAICTSILEIDSQQIKKYKGNYTAYQTQKQEEILRKQREYEQYIEERNRLERSIKEAKNSAGKVKKAPSRMGNSEARLHKRAAEEKKEKVEGHSKALETRLEKLEKKEKVVELPPIIMKMPKEGECKSKYLITADHITVSFGQKIILEDVSFQVENKEKLAFIGANGTGKTTLFRMIKDKDEKIKISPQVRLGYYSQELDRLQKQKTILQNVLKDSIQNEITVRNVLARLLFQGNSVYKKIEDLSGGEKAKVAIAKLLVSDSNVLLLDEPTNFLDIPSLEALENLIQNFYGTVVFSTHDRQFVEKIATRVYEIEDKKIREGGKGEKIQQKKKNENELLLLKMKMAEISSKIALEKDEKIKKELETQYLALQEEYRRIN